MTLTEAVTDRFSENYRAARSLGRVGRLISGTSVLLAIPMLVASFDEARDGRMAFFFFLSSFVGMLALIGYAAGRAVTAQARILRASVDCWVTASTVLSDADRVDLLSPARNSSWRVLGIGPGTSECRENPRPQSIGGDGSPIQSPIASLIASNPTSISAYFSPIERFERHHARGVRRRPR